MPPKTGSKRVETPDGVKYLTPDEIEEEVVAETKEETAPKAEEAKFTMDQVREMASEIASEAVKLMGHPSQPQGPQRIRNADLASESAGPPGIQTQDSVDMHGLSSDGRTHYPGFVPAVPEWVANFDMQEHGKVIGDLQGMGYRVVLNKAEFEAAWEPTKIQQRGDNEYVVPDRDRQEDPEAAAPLLKALADATPRYSLTYLLEHREERTISSEARLQRLVAEYTHNGFVARPSQEGGQASSMLAGLQARAGNMAGAGDNLGLELGSDAGAAQIESVRVS